MSRKYKIAAVICTYERYDLLPKAIEALTNQTLEKSLYEIIIIDNSKDNSGAQEIKEKFANLPNLKYVETDRPGLSRARNLALQVCEAEYIAYIDDDAIAVPNWLEVLLLGFELFSPDVAAVGGKVEGIFLSEPPLWFHKSLLSFLSVLDLGEEARLLAPDEWLVGTNMAFHLETLLDCGGFNENLGRVGNFSLLSNEETALFGEIRRRQKKIVYIPEAKVRHLIEPRRLTHEWFRRRVAWQAVSDCLSSSEVALDRLNRGVGWIYEYFTKMPPKFRNINALFLPTDSPELFRHQLDVIYLLTIALLQGENLQRL